MSSLPPIPPDIGRIAGPLVLGYMLNWALQGALFVQVYMYYLAFPRDPLRNKILVYGVLALEFAQTCLLCHSAFHTFATGYGNMYALDEIGLIWLSVPIMSGIVAFIAQVFYAYRIWILSQSWISPSIITFVSIASPPEKPLILSDRGGGIATGVESKRAKHHSAFLRKDSLITTGIWCGGSALCDVIIAVFMTYYLTRKETNWKPTQRIVNKLVRLVIETGMLTAAIATTNLILAVLPGRPTYYQTTAGVLGKMYSNAMMAVFNSRMHVGYSTSTTQEMSMSYRIGNIEQGSYSGDGYGYDDSALDSTFVTTRTQ
ncbi:hypothetical protein CPC08DRAFT_768677 [Agrocybe pediades]|nr:hypothetical protein CPC08DRAFT_768677 [Agrocybe pediades]